MSGDTLIILAGLAVNIVGTLAGAWRFAMAYERRMTTLEVELQHIKDGISHLPKRHGELA